MRASSRQPLRVVIAPDSFKTSISALAAASAISRGWRRVRPWDELQLIPQADGGEGTLEAVASGGNWAWQSLTVTGPDDRPVIARWLRSAAGEAIVELAQTSGIELVRKLDPLNSHTLGLGQLLKAVLKSGVHNITIALGGSVSTDGGSAALSALGARFLDDDGIELRPGGGNLERLRSVDLGRLLRPPAEGIQLLVDVENPLLGPTGTARTYAAQKGASAQEQELLERGMRRLSEVLVADPDLPGMGAAGGTAYGLSTAWGASIDIGSRRVAELTGLTSAVERADVVVLGEGRFDESSENGKVVGHALRIVPPAAHAVVIAGEFAQAPRRPAGLTVNSFALSALAGSRASALSSSAEWLQVAGSAAAESLTAGAQK